MNRFSRTFGVTLLAAASLSAIGSARAGFDWVPPSKISKARVAQPAPQTAGPLTPMPGDMGAMPIEPVSETDLMGPGPAAPVAPVAQSPSDNPANIAPSQVVQSAPGMRSINVLKKTETTTTETTATSSNAPTDLTLPEPGTMANPGEIKPEVLTPMPDAAGNYDMAAQSAAPLQNSNSGSVVEGFGKNIPLAIALRQVVPPTYTFQFESNVSEGRPVTWKGGRPWVDVLNDMLAARKLHAGLQGNVLIIASGSEPRLTLPADSIGDAYAPIQSASNSAASQQRPVVDLQRTQKWSAQSGQSLHEILQMWSSDAKTELAWQSAKDYKLTSAFAFEGTFDQAVDALLSLYGDDANRPQGTLYPNLPDGPSVLLIKAN